MTTSHPWAALARWPGLVRSARAGVPKPARNAALTAIGWTCERTLPTASDTAIALVRGPDGKAGALKLTVTGPGADSLRREREVLSWLRAEERLGEWRELVPEPLRWGTADGCGYLLTSRVPGSDCRRVPAARADELTAAAVAAIRPLHAHGQTVADADPATVRGWAEEPAKWLRELRPDHLVDPVVDAIRTGLAGARVTLGWTHGDFHPGNLLTGDGGAVTGIVDWDQATERDLVAVDLVFWLLTAPSAERGELGARVTARLAAASPWSPRETALLGEDVWESPAAGRALLLATWLRHVAGNLAKSSRYARSPLWARRNIDPVLRQAAGG